MNYSNYLVRVFFVNRVILVLSLLLGLNSLVWRYPYFFLFTPLIVQSMWLSMVDASTFVQAIQFEGDRMIINYWHYFNEYTIDKPIGDIGITVDRAPTKSYVRYRMVISVENKRIVQPELFGWDNARMKGVQDEYNANLGQVGKEPA